MPAWLDTLFTSIRLADVLDILIAAGVFYFLLSILREGAARTGGRRVLIALTVLALIHALAVRLHMVMLTTIIQASLILLALGGVLVFQTELRRLVDRIGSFSFSRQQPAGSGAAGLVDTLVAAVTRMAEMRRGALIALRGREPWDAHVARGIALGATPSEPLLVSLFNPTSPGHDGALLIEGGQITRFAAKLPLSVQATQIAHHSGTRHSAAVGLSERCDALVIAVSEEHGTICLAEGGVLKEVDANVLKTRLENFRARHHRHRTTDRPRLTGRRVRRAALAAGIAAALWLFFVYKPDVRQRTWTVPIEYLRPTPPLRLAANAPTEARITLEGTDDAFQRMDPEALRVRIDASRSPVGTYTFAMHGSTLDLPPHLSLDNAQPAALQLTIERWHFANLPVTVRATGDLPAGLRLESLTTDPANVTLLVPEENAMGLYRVYTEAVDMSRIVGTDTLTRRLVLPRGTELAPRQPVEVQVRVGVAGGTP